MGRQPEKQVRLGKNERKTVTATKTKLKNYVLSATNKKKGEVRLNDYLMDHLKQNPRSVPIQSSSIPSVTFMGETFRPEGFVEQSGKNLLCLECKKLVDKFAKSRWKEGLSQAIHYRLSYKVVFYVLYDFTAGAKYSQKFGAGRKNETKLAREMREKFNIYIIAIKPA
jgi:hypothetical protein